MINLHKDKDPKLYQTASFIQSPWKSQQQDTPYCTIMLKKLQKDSYISYFKELRGFITFMNRLGFLDKHMSENNLTTTSPKIDTTSTKKLYESYNTEISRLKYLIFQIFFFFSRFSSLLSPFLSSNQVLYGSVR